MQTKTQSVIESLTNIIVGLITSFLIQLIIYPLLDIPVTINQNLIITMVFFIASFLRGYLLRRFFKTSNKMKAFKLITSEEEIIAATTIISALKFYNDLTGISIDEMDEEYDIYEIPKGEWNEIKIQNIDKDDESEPDFWSLKELMDKTTKPDLISSTCW